ncbi:MAG: PIN domain-containing protein [Gammaproteobacteria bacterium]|nr:MAG: PIN domain-containing protein [Gammaproteobacteria bacterium]
MSVDAPKAAFIDTNILLYAHDRNAGDKQTKAAQLLTRLWENRSGILSTQVLQEFLVNATRKLPTPIALPKARDIVRTYGLWVTRETQVSDVLRATELMEIAGFNFWDSLILACAEAAGAEVLYSEDMQHGQQVAGLTIRNPFIE